MNPWFAADIALMLAIAVCAVVALRGKGLTESFVALQMAGWLSALALLVMAQAMHRPSFYDLALTVAVLAFPSALMFAHFVERWFR
ncbi:MAG TPA: monovalent cation/H+ antiporter complex subunit F [Verrucomicrobiae bacterium]|nr:monovalent cation/H+ antiporter complex subunit F [Verrucomicrobiae bacterium]